MGLIYRFGHGVAPDQSEATKWFRHAAERGDPVGQLEIGLMYFEGRGVPQDYSEAARWYQLAADRGNPEAQYNVGILYAIGKGVPQDNVLAHMWFNLAAAHSTARVGANRAAGNRDVIATKMLPDELSKAQELAREWKSK